MKQTQNFTEGKIFAPLIRFALPVLLTLFLQTMYGAVDLLVVGQFGTAADVSAVSTGSMVMHTVRLVITSLTMGLTVLVGRKIGEGLQEERLAGLSAISTAQEAQSSRCCRASSVPSVYICR